MNVHVDILANLIIQQYFTNCRCLLVFTDDENRFDFNGSVMIVNIRINSSTSYSRPPSFLRNHGCQGFIVKSNKPTSLFSNLEHEIKLTTERFNNRKYLFLPGDKLLESVFDIFGMQELKYVSNLVIVNSEEGENKTKTRFMRDEIMSLWTHEYVGMENGTKKLFLDLWFSKNQSFQRWENLYPNKLINQMGRKIDLATFHYEPYSIIGSSQRDHKGSEMLTALMFARQFNMTPQLVIIAEGYWGELFDNGTGYGLLGNLLEDRADIGFGGLDTWEIVYHFLDLSKPTVQTAITCIVPAPKLAAGWLTPLYSYSKAMWTAVGSVFFVCILAQFTMHYIQMKKPNHKNGFKLFSQSVFCIIKLFVQQVVTKQETPDGRIGKYFMGLLFIFSQFLSSSYSSGFSTVMTVPRYGVSINTVKEFVDSGLFWGATQDAWITSLQKAEDPLNKAVVSRFIALSEEEMRERSKLFNFAFSLERLPNKNYAIGSYIQKDVIGNYHLMKEEFYLDKCIMMTRKSSILLPLLDHFILQVFETGLISYWQNEVYIPLKFYTWKSWLDEQTDSLEGRDNATRLFMDTHVQRAVEFNYYNHQKRKSVVKLKWIHLKGAFGLLCIGYIISFLILILENIFHRTYSSQL